METANLTICNKLGLHARAASKLAETANRFAADITVSRDDTRIDAKSIMQLMMLAASKGTSITVEAEVNEEYFTLPESEPVAILCSSWDLVRIYFRVRESVVITPRRGLGIYRVYAGRVLNEGPLSITREVTAHQLVGNQPDVDWQFDVTLAAAER